MGDPRTVIWGTLSLLIIIVVAAFFFSKLVFVVIDHHQKENVHRLRELATLNEIYQTLGEFHNLNALLNRAMDKLIQITAADSGELYLVDEQSRELMHALHVGPLDDVFKRETHLQLKEWLIEEGAQLNQQVIMEDLKNFQSGPVASLTDA